MMRNRKSGLFSMALSCWGQREGARAAELVARRHAAADAAPAQVPAAHLACMRTLGGCGRHCVQIHVKHLPAGEAC